MGKTVLEMAASRALHITLPEAQAADAALDHLVSVLYPLSLLLVLDNCEHLVDGARARRAPAGHQPGTAEHPWRGLVQARPAGGPESP